MDVDIQREGETVRMLLNGRFDFSCHNTFIQGVDPLLSDASVNKLEVDFAEVTYIDSSALGMLLLLKERANGTSRSLTLVNCKGAVAQVLELAKFGQLFTIR